MSDHMTGASGSPFLALSFPILWESRSFANGATPPPLRVHPLIAVIALPAFALAGGHFLIDLLFVAIISPLMLFGGLRWNAGKIGVASGALSFPLYAVHFPVMELFGPWIGSGLAVIAAALLSMAPTKIRLRSRQHFTTR